MAQTDAICPFLPAFLKDVNEKLVLNLGITRGEIENALHQKLQSCGDKKKQATQLNVVSKCAALYMEQVEYVFHKNFAKLERYTRRNIVHFPKELQDDIEHLCKAIDSNAIPPIEKKQSQFERDKNEQTLKHEIALLHQKLSVLKAKKLAIESETHKIKSNVTMMQEFESKAAQIAELRKSADANLLSERVESLHRCIHDLHRLRGHLEKDMKPSASQNDRKRARYEELRRNFLKNKGQSNAMDIKELNKKL